MKKSKHSQPLPRRSLEDFPNPNTLPAGDGLCIGDQVVLKEAIMMYRGDGEYDLQAQSGEIGIYMGEILMPAKGMRSKIKFPHCTAYLTRDEYELVG